jgi:hypothetical protein
MKHYVNLAMDVVLEQVVAEAALCRVLNSWCGPAPSNLMCFFLWA